MIVLASNAGRPIRCGDILGMGGFGEVYRSPSGREAFKFGVLDFDRIRHLIANRAIPREPGYFYAWPEAILTDPITGQPCGYSMPAADDGVDTERLFSSVKVPEWFRVRVVLNHARSLLNLMAAGYLSGDMPNALVHQDGSISAIDLDSLQVNHPGAVFHSGYAKPSTAPPEVLEHYYHRGGEAGFETTREHDAWSFAALAWLVLMRGEQPFDAVAVGPGAAANVVERTIAGQWAYDTNCSHAKPRPGARPLGDLDPELQSLFRQTFVDGHPNRNPRNRPTIEAWEAALSRIDGGGP